MRIEIDFDERLFTEPVLSGLFVTARALRHVVGNTIERVRVSGHAIDLDGQPTKIIRCAVTMRVSDDAQTRTFEFAPGGRWRIRPSDPTERAPFTVLLPDKLHEYERDLINRTELQVGLLRHELFRWIRELQGPPAAGTTGT